MDKVFTQSKSFKPSCLFLLWFLNRIVQAWVQIWVIWDSDKSGGLVQPRRCGVTSVAWRSRIKWDVSCLFGSLFRGCWINPKIITAMLIARPITVIVKKSIILAVSNFRRKIFVKPIPLHKNDFFSSQTFVLNRWDFLWYFSSVSCLLFLIFFRWIS